MTPLPLVSRRGLSPASASSRATSAAVSNSVPGQLRMGVDVPTDRYQFGPAGRQPAVELARQSDGVRLCSSSFPASAGSVTALVTV